MTARGVLSRALGRLVADLGGVCHARGALDLQRLVVAVLKQDKGALVSAIRAPTVGALIRCIRSGSAATEPGSNGLIEELTALLALELARTSSLPAPVRLRRTPPRLLSLPGRFVVSIPPDCSELLFDNGRLHTLRAGDTAHEPIDLASIEQSGPYHVIDGAIALSLADNNPLAMMDAHPDKEGNAIDLGGRAIDEWVSALRSALDLIERHLPDIRREMDLYIHQIVPVGWDAERHLSASYQEAIGTIYISLHPSRMTMAEALIHEFSHNKLNALFELDDVLENAWSPLYASPVRPDPRPLHGVLLAVHAFLPVARLYERMIEAGDSEAESASFRERFTRVRQVNREGAEVVLAHGRPTSIGAGLLDEIRRWDAYFARWDAPADPPIHS